MPSSSPRIGGEYGKIRANIDIARLNAYLAQRSPAVKAPVDVKQFKVCLNISFSYMVVLRGIVWTGTNRTAFNVYHLTVIVNSQSNPTYFLTDARCDSSL